MRHVELLPNQSLQDTRSPCLNADSWLRAALETLDE